MSYKLPRLALLDKLPTGSEGCDTYLVVDQEGIVRTADRSWDEVNREYVWKGGPYGHYEINPRGVLAGLEEVKVGPLRQLGGLYLYYGINGEENLALVVECHDIFDEYTIRVNGEIHKCQDFELHDLTPDVLEKLKYGKYHK